jgi:YegS/Rv2252/BmrU family lipid kinase
MKILIIANPNAGGFKKISTERLKEYLTGKGAFVTLTLTTKKGNAKEIAENVEEGEYDVVAAAGGDGTVNEVVNGLAGRGISLGVIPMGTVNVFALETGIPFSPLKACDVILKNHVTKINLGRVDLRYFTLMVSTGFDAHVAYRIHGGLKSFLGMLAYFIHGLLLIIFYKFPKITVTTDDGVYHGYTVIISNMKLYAGRVTVTPEASFTKDDFEVCILTKKGIGAVFKFLFYVLFKSQRLYKALTFFKAKELKLTSDAPCHVQVDGDGIGSLPKKVTIVKDALSVVLPPVDGF